MLNAPSLASAPSGASSKRQRLPAVVPTNTSGPFSRGWSRAGGGIGEEDVVCTGCIGRPDGKAFGGGGGAWVVYALCGCGAG